VREDETRPPFIYSSVKRNAASGRDLYVMSQDYIVQAITMVLPELTTKRLTLSEAGLEDGPALMAYQRLPAHWRLQAVEPEEYTDGNRLARYIQYRGDGDARRLYVFVARNTATDQLIGEAGISQTYPKIFEIGFSVAPQHWGKNYGTEIARHLLEFGFCNLAAHRITASVAIENAVSCRVLEKIGMKREGTSRECRMAQGRWWDEHQYAILETDHRT